MTSIKPRIFYRLLFLGLFLGLCSAHTTAHTAAQGQPPLPVTLLPVTLRRFEIALYGNRPSRLIPAYDVPAQEGYPTQPEATPTLAQPYPLRPDDGAFSPNAPFEATAVPAPIGEALPPVDSGSSSSINVQPINPQANLGRYYLWGGFLATLFILGTVMYGAIILFIRRKD